MKSTRHPAGIVSDRKTGIHSLRTLGGAVVPSMKGLFLCASDCSPDAKRGKGALWVRTNDPHSKTCVVWRREVWSPLVKLAPRNHPKTEKMSTSGH